MRFGVQHFYWERFSRSAINRFHIKVLPWDAGRHIHSGLASILLGQKICKGWALERKKNVYYKDILKPSGGLNEHVFELQRKIEVVAKPWVMYESCIECHFTYKLILLLIDENHIYNCIIYKAQKVTKLKLFSFLKPVTAYSVYSSDGYW